MTRYRRSAWLVLVVVLTAILALVQVSMTEPRVNVRWREGVSPADRAAAERRYDLRLGTSIEGTANGWRYELGNRSRENIQALIQDPAVDDTGNIDRDALTAEAPGLRLSWRALPDVSLLSFLPFPFNVVENRFEDPLQLFQLQSLCLLVAGGVIISASRARNERRRRHVTVATLLLAGALTVALPIDPSVVTMGESRAHGATRENFESYFGGRVRFEKHLSQTILLQVYGRLDPTEAAPQRALNAVSRAATAWFVVCALAIGFLERWSAVVVRYVGLALLAPSALLYFGWRELGYLSLNVAAFPLLARGLRDGGARLEAGSALAGLGAALHGAGLVSLAGAWIAALGTSVPLRDRAGRALRAVAWGTAAYLGWLAVYVIVLKLPIDPGNAATSPWRPFLADDIREGRVSAAIMSATGARDLLMTAWIVGLPLLGVTASLWRQYRSDVRTALFYLVPSILFVMLRWPFQGIGGGMDLVVAGFPALYALAWVCAHDSKRTTIAAVLLASAHLAFWRVVFDAQFETERID